MCINEQDILTSSVEHPSLQPDVLLKTSILTCVNKFLFQIEPSANQKPLL